MLGGSDEKDFPNSIGWYSRSRNLVIHEPYKPILRSVDYSNWLVQCVNKPYLRTDISGAREEYEADDVIRLPGIQMGFTFTPSQNLSASASGFLLGYLDVNCHMTFRGRRLDDPLAAQSHKFHPYLGLQALPAPGSGCYEEAKSEKKESTDLSVSSIQAVLRTLKPSK